MPYGVFQFRRGTAAQWTAANPTLAAGELGLETDTAKFKIGDGTTAWNSLAYGGIAGPGVAAGGTTNQALTKNSNTNYDTGWSSVILSGASAGGDLAGTYPNPTLQAVTNAKLATVTAPIIKGRTTAGTGAVEDLSMAQATAMLNAATTSLQGMMSAADKIKVNGINKDIVADFGADPTGAVDATTIIQNALNGFTTSGGRLFFPAGTYKISGTITIAKPVIICGAGRAISNITTTAATGDMFLMSTGAQAAGFEQIRLTGATAGTRTAGAAVNFSNIANVYMQQCDIIFHWTGVISSGALQFLDDLNIREGGANAANGAAILVNSTGDRYIRRITTDQGASPTGYAGVRIAECSSCVLTDCNLIHSNYAIDITASAGLGHAVASVLATQCFFDTSVIAANITCATGNDTAQRIRFINCWFSTQATAGVVLGHANVNSVDFIGCDFYQSPYGIQANACTEWSVRASRFAGNTTNAIQTTAGASHAFTISDNFIGNGAGFGANAQGITIQAGSYDRYAIVDNRGLDTNTTPGIADNGTVTYPSSRKLIGSNLGTGLLAGTVASTTTAVSIANAEAEVLGILIAANGFYAGDMIRFTATGLWTNSTTSGTAALRWRLGPVATGLTSRTQIQSITYTTGTTSRTNQPFSIVGVITFITLGASGTAFGNAATNLNSATALGAGAAASTAAVTVNTTVENRLSFTAISGATGVTLNFTNAHLEVLV